MEIGRRRFVGIIGGASASVVSGSCRLAGAPADGPDGNDGRLLSRPRNGVTTSGDGRRPLGLASGRDAILQLPAKPATGPLPLLVLLHGAGGGAEGILRRLGAVADEAGIAVLAPESRGSTWDAIRDGFGADVAFLDRALARAFETVAVDPARVAVGGFSDGATYALSLGLINGDLFRRVLAFSPGFVVGRTPRGTPRFFVSHGTADPILPIDQCSRVIVPQLQRRGYEVTFREFEGRHEIPAAIAREGMSWIAST